ncbi:DNA-processing protein DprA [Brevibacillus fluminis]|uniref:DNA-processing protein DprA n=1 Tax=Brevibacillus fluminis TaxID=511487 RepID=UPI003F89484C
MKENLLERDWLYSLRIRKGVGRRTLQRLFDMYGCFSVIGQLDREELCRELQLSPAIGAALRSQLVPEQIEREKQRRLVAGQRFICILDPEFPESLREIPDPPMLLFYEGELSLLQKPLVAVVGARKPTSYGRSACQFLTEQLSNLGVGIVSGLALGIDAIAHQTAIRTGGATIAVLGCGLDIVYPRSNAGLFAQIKEKGLIVSEHPYGTSPLPGLFPERNRIISGLSLGTLVVEAAEKSGSLITADCALEQGRDVFAVPGPIFSEMSVGPHNLIKQGAKLVTNAADLAEEWIGRLATGVHIPLREKPKVNDEEQEILSLLSHEPLHFNQLSGLVKTESTRMLNKHLLMLETKGLIRSLPGGFYVKN